MKLLQRLSSLRLALAGMVLLAGGVLVSYLYPQAAAAWLVLPLLLLAVNLLAALLVNPRFRRQHGLLVFHLGLLAIVLLAAFAQLNAFKGRVELTEGQAFDPASVTVIRQGPWHPGQRLENVKFTQGSIKVHYGPGLSRGRTHSRIELPHSQSSVDIGDNIALESAGYRFHTTSNKGHAALLTWIDPVAGPRTGAVHFPSYPFHDWNQVNRWNAPGGVDIALELLLPAPPPETRDWALESKAASGSLRLTVGGDTAVLASGEEANFAGGTLRFEGLRLWMGYEVTYNPVLPWLFSAALISVLGLAWHFQERFRVPLRDAPRGEEAGSEALSAHV